MWQNKSEMSHVWITKKTDEINLTCKYFGLICKRSFFGSVSSQFIVRSIKHTKDQSKPLCYVLVTSAKRLSLFIQQAEVTQKHFKSLYTLAKTLFRPHVHKSPSTVCPLDPSGDNNYLIWDKFSSPETKYFAQIWGKSVKYVLPQAVSTFLPDSMSSGLKVIAPPNPKLPVQHTYHLFTSAGWLHPSSDFPLESSGIPGVQESQTQVWYAQNYGT